MTMIREVACPRCQSTLRVAPDAAGRWLTCPRCLASVGNPNVLLTTAPAGPPAAPVAEGRRCPGCGRPVERDWRFCPVCEEPLRGAPPRMTPVDEEVRGDGLGVGVGLVGLGLLGAVGLVLYAFGGGLEGRDAAGVRDAVGVGILLGAVLLVVTIVGMSLSAAARGTVQRVAGVTLGAVGLVVLVAVLILAAIVFTCASCFEGCKTPVVPTKQAPPPPPPGAPVP